MFKELFTTNIKELINNFNSFLKVVLAHNHDKNNSEGMTTDDIDGLINNDAVMHTKNAETIAGIKTFSSIPALPASDPTADNELVRKSYVDDNELPGEITVTDDYLQDSADNNVNIPAAEELIDWASYRKEKEIEYNEEDGDIRVKFDLKDTNGAGGMFGKVYINGAAEGVEREETAAGWVTYTEDFSVSNGDLIQIYLKYDDSGGGAGGDLRNFRLYYYKKLTITTGTINLN